MANGTSEQKASAVESDQQPLIMGRFQELFDLDAEHSLTLINIYHELPISHPAKICDIRGNFLELTTSALQLAAICLCNEVYIRSPHFAAPVLGRMDSIDVRRGVVRLCNFAFAELEADKRETVRVRFNKPIAIIVHSGTDRIAGVIRDISLGGCCIETLTCRGLEENQVIQVELKVIDHSTGLPNCTRIPCGIIQLSGDAAPFKCIFSFRHNQQTEQFLSRLIYQRQLEILKELRETLV
jgi:hypothetical protein